MNVTQSQEVEVGQIAEWRRCLRGHGREYDDAVARLHTLLLRGARFECARRRPALPHLRGNDLDDIANQAADDALVSILARLDRFRGERRFTTRAASCAAIWKSLDCPSNCWRRGADGATGSEAGTRATPRAGRARGGLRRVLRAARPLRRARARRRRRRRGDPGPAHTSRGLLGLPRRAREPAGACRRRAGAVATGCPEASGREPRPTLPELARASERVVAV